MQAEIFQYVLLVALAIGLLTAAITDLRSRKIANGLNAAIALGAPLYWLANGLELWPGVALQLAIACGAFLALSLLFAMRAMGGGDVKLLTALALWIPPTQFLTLLLVMAPTGGLLTVVFYVVHTLRRRRDRISVPYGIAIATGGLWVLSPHYF